jgi:hypothetical protein
MSATSAKKAKKEKKEKKPPKVVPLYNRYNDNFGVPNAESLEQEHKRAQKRMSELSGIAIVADDDSAQKRHCAQVDTLLTHIQQSLGEPNIIPLFQYLVFSTVFVTSPDAIHVLPIDRVHDNAELIADKTLFFECQRDAAIALDYLQRTANQLYNEVNNRVSLSPSLSDFHAKMRTSPQLVAEHHQQQQRRIDCPTAWDNEPTLRAGVWYTQLTLVHSTESIYVTREQGRILLLCYEVYHFLSLAKTLIANEYAREQTVIQGRSMTFCETWAHLTGGLQATAQWRWMNHNNTSLVKSATQLLEALYTAQKWIKGV